MRNKLSVVLLVLFLAGILTASLCNAADSNHPRTTFNIDRAPKFMIPFEREAGIVSPKGTSTFNLRADPPPTNSPGQRAGLTYYDYQHNGSMGRQVATNQSNGYVFIVWMAQDDTIIPGDRYIASQAYNAWGNPPDYVLDPGGYPSTEDYSGYTSCAWAPDGAAAFGAHTDPGTAIYKSTWYYDGMPNMFIWFNKECTPHPDSSWWQPETIWPIVAVHNSDSSNVTEDVVYVLSHVFEGSEDMILYRKVGTAEFDSGQYIETVTDLSYTIAPDANSDYVAIIYTDDRLPQDEGDGGQNDLDVFCKISDQQGACGTWSAPICVSNYTEEDSLWRAYSDVSAVMTPDGELHIIAPIRELRSSTSYENYKCRLVHWSVTMTTGAVSTASIIDEARYNMELQPNRPCDPDAWNLYIAKPSVSYCDGNLYALYTKFGGSALNDCSQAAFANGELFMGASDDGGVTWDTAWNITKTPSPNCDSADCESDHWSSMVRYGMYYAGAADTLDIMYINDKDAGGIPQGSGTWCVNNVMHYRFPCREVAHIPKVSLEPTHFLDPNHTAPGVPMTVPLKISNIGNLELTIQGISVVYDNGADSEWIALGAYDGTVPTSSFITLNVTMNANGVLTGDPTGWDARIIIDTDAPTDKDTVEIHLTVASDFNMPEFDTLSTTCKQIMVYNTGRLGGDNDGVSLNIPDDCDSVDTPPNELIYLYDASPMMAWLDNDPEGSGAKLTYTTVFTQDFTEDYTFRPQSNLNFQYGVAGIGGNYDMVTCTLTTSDSLYGVAVDLYAPTDGLNCFIVGHYTFFNWQPVKGASDVYLGFIMDWDIPSDNSVDNWSGYDAVLNTMWQQGAEYESDNTAACGGVEIPETDRYGGMAVLHGLDEGLLNAWAEENAPHQLGSGYDPIWLYDQMSTLTNYNSFTGDSAIDLHMGMTFAKVDMTTKTSKDYWVTLVTTNTGEIDYKTQVAAANAWCLAQEFYADFVCDCLPGDANGDGAVNVGDAVYTISYVFKGGPAPTPYNDCSGDANGDCTTNVGDAVYTISYVFKGGPPPVTCEVWADDAVCGKPLH